MERIKIEENKKTAEIEPILEYQNTEEKNEEEDAQPASAKDYDVAKKIYEIRQKIDELENKPKKSSVSRVVGNLPQKDKQEILESMDYSFANQNMLKGEKKKTKEQREILEIVNQVTNEILQKYGLENFDIPEENNHIIDEKILGNRSGDHNQPFQRSRIENDSVRSAFMANSFHEDLHFKSYQDWQILRNKPNKPEISRCGLMIITRDKGKVLFKNLNEAITEAMCKKYAPKLLSHPLFKTEQEETQKIITDRPVGTFDSDIFYLRQKISFLNLKQILLGKPEREYEERAFLYVAERQALSTLIKKLFTKNPAKFKNEEEIMEMFEKAMLGGNINSIGKLIDHTFGKETFRRIGELGEDTKGLADFINTL
jgi:hypothetical protein